MFELDWGLIFASILACAMFFGFSFFIKFSSEWLNGIFTHALAFAIRPISPILCPINDLRNQVGNVFRPVLGYHDHIFGIIGTPATILLIVAASVFSWWRINELFAIHSPIELLEMLFNSSSIGYLYQLAINEGDASLTDVPQIIVSGLNSLLMATISFTFMASMTADEDCRPHIVFQFLYGVIFLVFTMVLGTMLPDDLGFSVPEKWWTMAEVTLPQFTIGETVGVIELLQSTGSMIQRSLNLLIAGAVIYTVGLMFLYLLSNALCTIACGLLAVGGLFCMALVLQTVPFLNQLTPQDALIALPFLLGGCVVWYVIVELLFMNFSIIPSPSIGEILDNRPHEEGSFHPFTLIFGGFFGGPFLWNSLLLAIAMSQDVIPEAYQATFATSAMIMFLIFVGCSIPAMISFSLRRKHNQASIFGGILFYLFTAGILLPLLMFIISEFYMTA